MSSFCVYCGYVYEQSWWDKLRSMLDQPESSTTETTPAGVLASLVGVAVAAFFLMRAVRNESLFDAFYALLALFLTLRAWFTARNRREQVKFLGTHSDQLTDMEGRVGSDVSMSRLSCDNCGLNIAEQVSHCPACGAKLQE